MARCARCGTLVDPEISSLTTCPKCQQQLRSCVQCAHFDPSARFECTSAIPARISPKDTANDCPAFEARSSWERETTAAAGPGSAAGAGGARQGGGTSSNARKAFDDLFKF